MEITNKNVFITGSTRGIGLAIAHEFAKQGANVILNGRSPISQTLLKEFYKYDSQVLTVLGDISNLDEARRMVDEAISTLGSIDILINNAGITNDKLALNMSQVDFEKVLNINLIGAFNMTQAVLKPMVKARQGAIINMSSVSALIGNIGQSNYSASKAGLIGLTKSIAKEVASKNVRVNVLAPGLIKSDMTSTLPAKTKKSLMKNIPMKRFGTVEEIAETALFLAKQEYLTGQVIVVDGGLSM